MIAARIVLLILALCCFVMAALGVSSPRGNLVAAGLAFLTGAELIR